MFKQRGCENVHSLKLKKIFLVLYIKSTEAEQA